MTMTQVTHLTPLQSMMACAIGATCLAAACTVGDGTGEAKGQIYLQHCFGSVAEPGGDYGTPEMPRDFELSVGFYAGEPIEDIKKKGSDNRLIVRMQNAGRRIEDNDVLVFDMMNWRVAQCLHGNPDDLADAMVKRFCDWAPGKTWPRMRVGPDLPIKANLALRKSCPGNTYVVAAARDLSLANPAATAADWGSWIELRAFGDAVPDSDKTGRVDPTFKVEFGQRLFAEAFHVDLMDERVVHAEKRGELPPDPDMRASLDGNFDFFLQRGQGAQTFP